MSTEPEEPTGHDPAGHPIYPRTEVDDEWAAVLAELPVAAVDLEEVVYPIIDHPDGVELWARIAATVGALAERETRRR